MTPQEITMQECLSATGIRELPPKIGEDYDKTWLRAICEVVKVGGRREYCLCENDGHGKPIVKRDFGVCAAIVYIANIHPYDVADNTIVPTFKNNDEILHYLTKSKYDRAEIETLLKNGDMPEIQRRINAVAMSAQKSKIAERKRVNQIKEFAQKAKEEKKEKLKTNGRRKKKENN